MITLEYSPTLVSLDDVQDFVFIKSVDFGILKNYDNILSELESAFALNLALLQAFSVVYGLVSHLCAAIAQH